MRHEEEIFDKIINQWADKGGSTEEKTWSDKHVVLCRKNQFYGRKMFMK